MRKIQIDLDSLTDEALEEIALTTNDYDLINEIYGIGLEKNNTRIFKAILKNENKIITKDIVEEIARSSKKEYEFVDFDNKESFKEASYDKSLVDLLAANPSTPEDVLTDMVYSGEVSALFNLETPSSVIETFILHPNIKEWVINNPDFIKNLMTKCGFKLTNITLKYIQSLDFNDDEEKTINALAWQILERRKQRRTLRKQF